MTDFLFWTLLIMVVLLVLDKRRTFLQQRETDLQIEAMGRCYADQLVGLRNVCVSLRARHTALLKDAMHALDNLPHAHDCVHFDQHPPICTCAIQDLRTAIAKAAGAA